MQSNTSNTNKGITMRDSIIIIYTKLYLDSVLLSNYICQVLHRILFFITSLTSWLFDRQKDSQLYLRDHVQLCLYRNIKSHHIMASFGNTKPDDV